MDRPTDFTKLSPPTSFTVAFEPNFTKIDEQKSLARLRIFYKGLNRNGTYITEDFAEYLLKSLPGTPTIGEYDSEKGDFTQHTGVEKTKGYGFVPLDMNFSWESHTDEDGVERDYATCDVVLWTKRYDEANKIIGKSHSMELDPDSIDGSWSIKNGLPIFTYTKAEFFGLCVLGEDFTPCFEGSSFYALDSETKDLIRQLREEYTLNLELFTNNNEGGKRMDYEKLIAAFKLSHDEIYMAIWDAVNPRAEEGEYFGRVLDVYDDYALVREYGDTKTWRLYYTKNDDNNTVTLGEKVEVFIVDVTQEEYDALSYIQSIKETYALAAEEIKVVEEFKEKNPEFDFTVDNNEGDGEEGEEEDNENLDTTFTTEEEDNKEDNDENDEGTFAARIKELEEENRELKEFKEAIELENKKAILEDYSTKLSEEVMADYTIEKVGDMSIEELERELAYRFVKTVDLTQPADFSKVPNQGQDKSALVALLEKYVVE